MPNKTNALDALVNWVRALFNPTIARDISFSNLAEQTYYALQEATDYGGFIHDFYIDESGVVRVLFSNQGKLFASIVIMTDGAPTVSDPIPVEINLTPMSRTTVERQVDGKYRWISVSCTSILNRTGQIDSRELFDSFVAEIERTGNYPYRTFFHQGEVFKTGVADFVARDGYALITSGFYDDSEIAAAEVKARLAEPDFWGESIGFHPTAQPTFLKLTDDVSVPVYTRGVIQEISTLPEKLASALFTSRTVIREMEVRRMDKAPYEAFVKLFGSEEKANEWLEANSIPISRAVEDQNLIARAEGEIAPETPETPETPVEPVVENREIVLDESSIAAIGDYVTNSDVQRRVTEAVASLTATVAELSAQVAEFKEQLRSAQSTVKTLTKDEQEKRMDWLADLSRTQVTKVTYRPSSQAPAEDPDPVVAAGNPTLKQKVSGKKPSSAVAADTLKFLE